MILLKKLKLINFLSHKDTTLEFLPEQKILLDGKSGSGKSAIVEAIIWALYNQGRSDNRSLVRRGSTTARVTLFFDDDDISYKIERSITKTGKHDFELLKKNGEAWEPLNIAGIKNTQEFLEKRILHSSYLLFINSIAYPQDNIENFIKQSASKRKDILLEIIRAANYDDYYAMAKEKLAKIIGEVALISGLMSEKTTTMTLDREVGAKLPDLLTEEQRLREKIKGLKEKLDAASKIVQAEREGEVRIKSIENECVNLNNEISASLVRLEERKKEVADLEGVDMSVISEGMNNLILYRTILGELEKTRVQREDWNTKFIKLLEEKPAEPGGGIDDINANITALNNELVKLLSVTVETCPETNKACPISQRHKDERIKFLSEELVKNKKIVNQYESDLVVFIKKKDDLGPEVIVDTEKIKATQDKIAELEPYEQKFLKYQNLKEEIAIKKSNVEMLMASISGTQARIEDLSREKKQLEGNRDPFALGQKNEYERQIEEQNRLFIKNQQDVAIADAAVKRVEENEKFIIENRDKVNVLESQKESVELIKEAFGSKGLKSLITEMVIPQLEDKINSVLSSLSNFKIKLETQKEAVSGESTIDGLFINILNDQGEEFDLENYSGGEKVKITTAISEGLASMQNIGFRIFDENIVGLDADTIDSFVEVMISIKERFKQLICISHIQQVKETFMDVVSVAKTQGISTIK